ncbi:MAG: DUF4157 domain-containing protein [Myxococcales bacterium]|nr:DUF4157 domain-containing protein [Myxococcales bacterium]
MNIRDNRSNDRKAGASQRRAPSKQQRLDSSAPEGAFAQSAAGDEERGPQRIEARDPQEMGPLPRMDNAISHVLNDWVSDAAAGPASAAGGSGSGRGAETVARDHAGKGHEPSSDSISHYAHAGMQGTRVSLPYRTQLERSFGASLDDIPVYEGDRATEAARAMNANAYAYRGSIVLGDRSDLRTVAEETAHVLQARSGRMDGAGAITDPHGAIESEASSIADSVSAGRSVGAPSMGLGAETVARNPLEMDGAQSRKREGADWSPGMDKLMGDMRVPNAEVETATATMAKKAPDMNPAERQAHLHTQGSLFQQGLGAQDPATLSKVVPGGGGMISGQYGSKVGGSIGYAETTAGRSANETKAILGLDYQSNNNPYLEKDPATGKPAVDGDGRKQFNDRHLTYLEFGATPAMQAGLGVPLTPDMAAQADAMKAAGDPTMQGFQHTTTMGPDGKPVSNLPGVTDAGHPFRGTGMSGSFEAPGVDIINQELYPVNAGEQFALPAGAKMMHRDNDPSTKDQLVATYEIGKDGKGKWKYNEKCDPKVLSIYKEEELTSYNAMKKQLTESDKKADECKAAAEKLEGDAKTMKTQADSITAEIASLRSQLAAAKDDAAKKPLETQITQKQTQCDKLKSDAAAKETAAGEKKKEEATAREKSTELKAKIPDDATLDTLKKEIDDLKAGKAPSAGPGPGGAEAPPSGA